MKKIIALFIMVAACAGIATAAPKAKAEKKIATVVFTTNLDCEHCAKKVMNTIPYERGIKDVQVDVPTKRITVKFDAAKNNIEALTKAIEGIDVKVIKAEEQKANAN